MKVRAETFAQVRRLPSWQTIVGLAVLAVLAARGLSNAMHDAWGAANDNFSASAEDTTEHNDGDKGLCDLSPSGYHEPGEPFVDFTIIGKVTVGRCKHCNELLFSFFEN